MSETNFTSLGFSSQQLIETLSSRYQNIPTEFQIKAIPSLLQNQWYDLVLRAPAFSGKSVAILSSMLDNCIQNKAKNVRGLKQVFAIIVAPSNNSAVLLVEEALKLVENIDVGISFAIKYDDQTMLKSFGRSCDILIGTIDCLHEVIFNESRVRVDVLSYFIVSDAHHLEKLETFKKFYNELIKVTHENLLVILSTTQMGNDFDKFGLNVAQFVDFSPKSSFSNIVHEFFDVTPEIDNISKVQYLLIFLDQFAQKFCQEKRFPKSVIFANDFQTASMLTKCLRDKSYSVCLMPDKCKSNECDTVQAQSNSDEADIIIGSDFGENVLKARFMFNFDLPESAESFHQLTQRFQQVSNIDNSYLIVFSFFDCTKNSNIAHHLEKFFIQCNANVPEFVVKACQSHTDQFVKRIKKVEDQLRALNNTFNAAKE